MSAVVSAFAWIKAHPAECVQYLAAAWAIANVLWAQWPKPKSPKAQAIWQWVHTIMQLVVTHSSAAGTFTWPAIIRSVLTAFTQMKAPNPFESPDDTDKLAQAICEAAALPEPGHIPPGTYVVKRALPLPPIAPPKGGNGKDTHNG